MRVPGDVVAPLLGSRAALAARPGVAEPHSPERGPVHRHGTGGATRGAGEDPHPAGRRAPAQRQRGSSRERVHADCGKTHEHTSLHADVNNRSWLCAVVTAATPPQQQQQQCVHCVRMENLPCVVVAGKLCLAKLS